MDSLILSIGVVVGVVCIYPLWTVVIRTRNRRRDIVDETRLDALRKIEQTQSYWPR